MRVLNIVFLVCLLTASAFGQQVTTLASTTTRAGGHEKGGRQEKAPSEETKKDATQENSSQVFFEGKWLLADAFVSSIGQFMEMSPEMKKYLKWILVKMNRHGIGTDRFYGELFGLKTEYIFVNELPCTDKTEIPNMTTEEQACTRNNITYILKTKTDRLDFQNMAMTLIHERLHSFSKVEHILLMSFVDMLSTYAKLAAEQEQNIRRPVTTEEATAIRLLARRAYQLGFPVKEHRGFLKVWPNGGARIFVLREDDTPLISADSFMDVDSSVEVPEISKYKIEFSTVRNSNIIDSSVESSTLADSSIARTSIIHGTVKNSSMKDTSIVQSSLLKTKLAGVAVSNSSLTESSYNNTYIDSYLYEVVSDLPGKIVSSELFQTTLEITSVESSRLSKCELRSQTPLGLAQSTTCINSQLSADTLTVGAGAQVTNVKIKLIHENPYFNLKNSLSIPPRTDLRDLDLRVEPKYHSWNAGKLNFVSGSVIDFGNAECKLKEGHGREITVRLPMDLLKHCVKPEKKK